MKKYTEKELNKILEEHEMWIAGGTNGQQADFTGTDFTGIDFTGANLTDADFTGVDFTGANLTDADFTDADFTGVDFTGANIDFSCWPLNCNSLKAHVDDRIAVQLLYHTLAVVKNSPYVSDELKDGLLTKENIAFANRFHRTDECKVFKEEVKYE